MSKANLPTQARVNAIARGLRGRALDARTAGNLTAAVDLVRHSQLLHPDEPLLTFFEGHCSFTLERGPAARSAFRRTVSLQPSHASAWRYLGIQAFTALDGAAAEAAWRRSLMLDPGDPAALYNLFQARRQRGQWDQAIRAGVWSSVLKPEDDTGAFDLGMLYLALGRWADGWPLYDRRIRLSSARLRPDRFALPHWDGHPNPALRLLVWCDQNVGDEMQFAQLIPDLCQRVGHVTVECDARLVPVFARSFPSISVIARSEPPASGTAADAQIPQGHLGRILRPASDSFAATPRKWLTADAGTADRLRRRYRDWAKGAPVVGIAWKSANQVFRGKNVPLEDWVPVLRVPGVRFLSLQYGEVADDLATLRDLSGVTVLHDPAISALHDLDGFGAQLDAVDLVISISNSTIHQACGLGRPVWAMLHLRPDWRWGVEGETCPWFPTLRLYRQTTRFEWTPVASAVAADLSHWAAAQHVAAERLARDERA
ncbi:MAG: tetratricopeptide repeat protein [Thalassobaculaceae bacterium]|nr:tetratricopeptide repeat protein [Thalassobaculaceae bacterium]